MPYRSLPTRPNLEHLKYQAKDLVNSHKAGTPEAVFRIKSIHPKFTQKSEEEIRIGGFSLTEAQLVIAREYGFESWTKLKRHVEALARPVDPPRNPALQQYHDLVEILGRMKSLERIELCSVPGVTNAGLAFLANLPRLRQLRLSELPNATRESVAVFPASVRVEYSV